MARAVYRYLFDSRTPHPPLYFNIVGWLIYAITPNVPAWVPKAKMQIGIEHETLLLTADQARVQVTDCCARSRATRPTPLHSTLWVRHLVHTLIISI